MKSMTGFVRQKVELLGHLCIVSIRSVNSRNLDVYLRLPEQWLHLDSEIRKIATAFFHRGKVSIVIEKVDEGESSQLSIREEDIKKIVDCRRLIQQHYPEVKEANYIEVLRYLSTLSGSYEIENRKLDVASKKGLEIIFDLQLRDRQTEGDILSRFFIESTDKMAESLQKVKESVPFIQQNYEKRLREKCQQLLAKEYEERILTEIAILCEKSDITEEIVRLEKHINHLKEVIDTQDVCGKKLDFTFQEALREVNTIGSKSSDYNIVKEVLLMKGEIDKMREQVCNVE